MDAPDYSFVGSGIILLREWGSAAPLLEVGNCSAAALEPQTNTLSLPDHRNSGGGERNSIDRITSWNFNYTFHDFNKENFARVTRGVASAIASGTVTEEPAVAYVGGWVPLKFIASAITAVEPAGGGTAYVAGTDYIFDRGMLFIPTGSSIPAPTLGAPNIDVTYSRNALGHVEGAVTSGKFYEMHIRGQNEARAGKFLHLGMHKVKGGTISSFGLIGDDYGAGEVAGSLTADPAKKTASNVSEYFYWQQEE